MDKYTTRDMVVEAEQVKRMEIPKVLQDREKDLRVSARLTRDVTGIGTWYVTFLEETWGHEMLTAREGQWIVRVNSGHTFRVMDRRSFAEIFKKMEETVA